MKKLAIVAVLATLGISAYGYLGFRTSEFVPEVSTVALARGDVVDTVGATGALEAVTTVQVGSQVSGIIDALYADFNSIVREGDVIARLEPSLFQSQVEQSRANLARAEADVARLTVALEDARTQLRRSEELAAQDLIAASELEAAQVAVRSAQAQLQSAEASVIQSRASLNQSEVNLGHTVITAPIDGIVIARQVDVGQTVAASMSAPELFIIAADLTEMQVIANIDESDVGRIRPGQPVTFTVDAYAAEEFEGTVSQIRLEPVVLQQVVTYATVIDVPNNDLRLKPGMTATVTLEIARREDVLRVPNSALRFRPTPDMFAVLNQPVPEILQRGGDGRPGGGAGGFGGPGGPGGRGGGGRVRRTRWGTRRTGRPGRGRWTRRVRQHVRCGTAGDARAHSVDDARPAGRVLRRAPGRRRGRLRRAGRPTRTRGGATPRQPEHRTRDTRGGTRRQHHRRAVRPARGGRDRGPALGDGRRPADPGGGAPGGDRRHRDGARRRGRARAGRRDRPSTPRSSSSASRSS